MNSCNSEITSWESSQLFFFIIFEVVSYIAALYLAEKRQEFEISKDLVVQGNHFQLVPNMTDFIRKHFVLKCP